MQLFNSKLRRPVGIIESLVQVPRNSSVESVASPRVLGDESTHGQHCTEACKTRGERLEMTEGLCHLCCMGRIEAYRAAGGFRGASMGCAAEATFYSFGQLVLTIRPGPDTTVQYLSTTINRALVLIHPGEVIHCKYTQRLDMFSRISC